MKIISGILSYNRFDSTTKLCLDSLLPQIKELKDFKLIVLDNKSTDKSEKKLEEYYKNNLDFTLTLSQENLGFTAGFNKLFKDNDAEWILLIDSDTIFPKNSINNLIKAFKHNEDVFENTSDSLNFAMSELFNRFIELHSIFFEIIEDIEE